VARAPPEPAGGELIELWKNDREPELEDVKGGKWN